MKEYDDITGIIYDVQRYSVHDGPGIRTTVFLKGCPLRCLWCSNPESQNFEIEHMKKFQSDEEELVGKKVSVKEVMEAVLRDKVFFDNSGGGVTLSGGEVLAQPQFASAIIAAASEAGVHTAVETSGFSKFETAWKVFEHVDLILYDIKGMDDEEHKINTGVSNEVIHENLKKLIEKGKEVIVRVPLIPDHNDSVKNIQGVVDFSSQIGVKSIEILPYHRLGEGKYERLSREYQLKGLKTQPKEYAQELLSKISKPDGLKITV